MRPRLYMNDSSHAFDRDPQSSDAAPGQFCYLPRITRHLPLHSVNPRADFIDCTMTLKTVEAVEAVV